jgi:hypothetical protein
MDAGENPDAGEGEMRDIKTLLLKWLLVLGGVVQIVYWGISHLFFPGWYLESIGMKALASDPGEVLIFLHEIGVLAVGFGIATILAARDPVKHFAIIVVLYVVGVGSVLTSLYHILFQGMASGEWATVVLITIQLVLLTILYPWSAVKRAS